MYSEQHGKIITFSIGGITFKDSYAFMQSGLDKLVNNLKADQLINTRRYLEVIEAAKMIDSGDDNDSVSSDEDMDSDDEAFIDDRNVPEPMLCDSDDDEEDVQWMATEIEKLSAPTSRYEHEAMVRCR